jgi:hypothetical protein
MLERSAVSSGPWPGGSHLSTCTFKREQQGATAGAYAQAYHG